jgi:hypothetical protein
MSLTGKLTSAGLQGSGEIKLIPLVIRYAAGTPSVLQNPTGEAVALTDNGTGDVTITLSDAAAAPLIVGGLAVRPSAPGTLGLNANVSGACTTTAVRIVVNSDADGTTETDPVDVHVLLVKQSLS